MKFDAINALNLLQEELPEADSHRVHIESSKTHYIFALSLFWKGEIYTSQFMVSHAQAKLDEYTGNQNFQFRLALTRLKREMEHVPTQTS